MPIELRVYGIPAPQGSKRHVGNGVMIESSKKVKPWRQDVKYAALGLYSGPIFEGPLRIKIHFIFPRPKSHFGTGRNAGRLKENAPKYVTSRGCGDLEKLIRSTLDALSVSSGGASIMRDDSQVCCCSAIKRYAFEEEKSGAIIVIRSIDDEWLH